MATLFDWGAPRPADGSAGGAATPSAPGSSQATSNTYFSNPDLVKAIAEALGGTVGGAAKAYGDFAANPVASDTFQTQLKSLLARLAPGEADARTALTDQFRAAGGLRSGAYGTAGARLEGDIIGKRQDAAGTLLGQVIQQMTSLLGLPLTQVAPLIKALELQTHQQSSQSWAPGTGSSSTSSSGFATGDPWGTNANYFKTPGFGRGQPGLGGAPYEIGSYGDGRRIMSDGSIAPGPVPGTIGGPQPTAPYNGGGLYGDLSGGGWDSLFKTNYGYDNPF